MPTIEPFWQEWRELGAARRLVLAVASAGRDMLQVPNAGMVEGHWASAVCDMVERCFGQLARPPSSDETLVVQRLRRRLPQLARTCGRADREGRERLLGTAVTLWGDASQRGRLHEKLEQRAVALTRPDGAAKFQRLIKDVLWEAEADGVATRQRRRNWKGVREVSLELLPNRKQDGDRCTLAHFDTVAERIKRTRQHDRNLPRTPDAVGELFYLFCSCCVGVSDPRLPGSGGQVQHRNAIMAEEGQHQQEEPDEVGTDPTPEEMVDTIVDVAPDRAAALVSALRNAISVLPPRDQVVLANLLDSFNLVGLMAKRAFPAFNAETSKSRDRTAAVLAITCQELAQERQRMDEWFVDISYKLTSGGQ